MPPHPIRTLAAAAVLATAAAPPPAARADELRSTLDQRLEEISHTVDVRIADGVATYVVQRQFRNHGKRADEARLAIHLPSGAAATGLRIRAGAVWHTGELLDHELAATRYRELTGAGVYDPKDPALLFWLSSSQLYLQVFPVLPGATSTVEYTLTVPTRYADGRYWLTYPRPEPGSLATAPRDLASGDLRLAQPILTVGAPAGAAISLDGKPVAAGRPAPVPSRSAASAPAASAARDADDPDPATALPGRTGANALDFEPDLAVLTVAPPPATPPWTGRLARVVASTEHAFSRLEVDLAAQVSAVPRRAQVVFVLDTSHSAGPTLIEAQLALLRAYLAHVPDAELEIIAVRRAARRVFGRFVPARDAGLLLAQAARTGAFAPGNGSALDAGARLAAAALAGRPGPQRVVIATDELLRSSLTDAAALATLAQLAPAAVVHVVVPAASADARPALSRDDAASLAPLATAHHGIFARVSGLPGKPAELGPVALELVRPTRIDHLAATGGFTVDPSLPEGEGLRLFEPRAAVDAPARIALTGALWSDPIRLEIPVSPALSTATAAFVFGADLHAQLSEPEQRTVALAGRAVSPVTSYLAIEPGVRPSKIGLPEGGGSGWGTIGLGRYGTIGHGSGSSSRSRPDLQSLIATAPCLRKHAPAGPWSIELAIETTRDEIVDVAVRQGAGPLADCLVEATWAVRLDDRFDQDRETFSAAFSEDSGALPPGVLRRSPAAVSAPR